MKRPSLKKIILAVDLKAADPKLTLRLWNAIQPHLTPQTIVEPVCVLNREDAAIGKVLSKQIGGLRSATERHLADKLAEIGVKKVASPKVLFADGSSTQRAVQALLSYAKKSGCQLIAVSSHSRKGVKRFLLGSFAETLSLQSSIPLLVVNPAQAKPPIKSAPILFPTDFSEVSAKGLQTICDSMRGQKSKIILFHSYLFPGQIYVDPYAAYPVSKAALAEDLANIKRTGESWCSELRRKGIPSDFVLNKKNPFVSEAILSAISRHKVGMVAMVSNTGRLGAILLGSATRQVLRNSPCPVWIVHPGKPKN